jgi:hypothetical protein
MSLSPFDVSKNLLNKDIHFTNDDLKGYSAWMVNKIFSCHEQYAFIANALSRCGINDGVSRVTDRMNYDCYFYLIPKNPKLYIPYSAKKPKAEKEIQYIMEYYQCNQNDAKTYHKLMSEADMKAITEYFENRGVKGR